MARWRELAARATADASAPIAPPAAGFGLPPALERALIELDGAPPPRRLESARYWREITSDAVRLAREGWAAKALALGWSPHDLFGVGVRDNQGFEGLAVWLGGRSIAALAQWQARTTCGALFYREAFMRPRTPPPVAVMLWEFAR